MYKICFTGAQGTGKTTMLNELATEKEKGIEIITEVVRKLSKKGVKINKEGDETGQTRIFNDYKKLLTKTPGFISDRGLIDVVAYTVYLARHNNISEEFANKQLKALHKFVKENNDIMYCFFPIEFDIAADGVRDTDEQFRVEISEIILTILAALKISFVYIKGTVEERTDTIKKLIDWKETGDSLFINI